MCEPASTSFMQIPVSLEDLQICRTPSSFVPLFFPPYLLLCSLNILSEVTAEMHETVCSIEGYFYK